MTKRSDRPIGRRQLTVGEKIRIGCITTLWLVLCYLLVTTRPVTLWLLFVIAASGIIVFVPLYKKYFRHGEN